MAQFGYGFQILVPRGALFWQAPRTKPHVRCRKYAAGRGGLSSRRLGRARSSHLKRVCDGPKPLRCADALFVRTDREACPRSASVHMYSRSARSAGNWYTTHLSTVVRPAVVGPQCCRAAVVGCKTLYGLDDENVSVIRHEANTIAASHRAWTKADQVSPEPFLLPKRRHNHLWYKVITWI